METENKQRVSYTQYSMWMQCPGLWKLSYVNKLKPEEPSIYLTFGTAMHETIQAWLAVLYEDIDKATKLYDLSTEFKDRLITNFKIDTAVTEAGKVFPCDRKTLDEFYLDGTNILHYLRKHHKDVFEAKNGILIGCEIPLELTVAPYVGYVGYIDIVAYNPKTKTITLYDLKTSTKGWKYEKNDPKKINQLLLYKNFYSTIFNVPLEDISVQFVILKRKLNENNQWDTKRITVFEPQQDDRAVRAAVSSFNGFLTSVFDTKGNVRLDNLPFTPSKSACRFCPFRNATEYCSVSAWRD